MTCFTPGKTLRVSGVRSSAFTPSTAMANWASAPNARSSANWTASSTRWRACMAGFPVLTVTSTWPSETALTVTQPRVTTSLPNSGSNTPFRASSTASSVQFIAYRFGAKVLHFSPFAGLPRVPKNPIKPHNLVVDDLHSFRAQLFGHGGLSREVHRPSQQAQAVDHTMRGNRRHFTETLIQRPTDTAGGACSTNAPCNGAIRGYPALGNKACQVVNGLLEFVRRQGGHLRFGFAGSGSFCLVPTTSARRTSSPRASHAVFPARGERVRHKRRRYRS